MPNEGLNIYFTITDKASPVLANLGDKTKALDKETQQLSQSYVALRKANEPLIKQQAELEKKLIAAKKEAKEAEKAFKKLGDSASADAYDKAKQHQRELQTELAQTNSALKENEAIFKQNMETVRKSSVGGGAGTSLTSLAKGLAAGQVGQMLASSLGQAGTAFLTSAIGTPEASLISNSLSNAIAGATAGAVAGIPGIIAGGIIGAASGVISGVTEIKGAKDDAFKEYYVGLYESVNAATEEMISGGSTIAGSREQTRQAFIKRFGSEAAADAYLGRVQSMAASTNYGYDEIVGYSQSLLNAFDSDSVFGILQSLSDATAGLNLSSSDVSTMISGLTRMQTTGKATQEYLNYFSERGVDVYTALSEALGVDKSQIAGMVSKGSIGGEFAADAILDYINKQYGGLSVTLMDTYDAKVANLEDIMDTLNAAGGEGYNEMRKPGLDAESEAYSGALGDAVAEINRIAGENKAYLENLSEQYTREALSAVLMGEKTTVFSAEDQAKLDEMAAAYEAAEAEYAAGNQEAGLTMERLKEEAEALAIAAYESSSQYQTYMDDQLTQISEIRGHTADMAAIMNEYKLNQERSRGMAAVPESEEYLAMLHQAGGFSWKAAWSQFVGLFGGGSGNAYGLSYVPRDNYPALLHEGERVLTASEARALKAQAADGGRIIQISVTGNSFVGTGEEMADQIAEILARKLEGAAVIAVPS